LAGKRTILGRSTSTPTPYHGPQCTVGAEASVGAAAKCTHRSDWMSAATMPNWILDSEMKGDGRPSGPWAGWTVAVAVLSSGIALSDPTRPHRRQHRLCYDYAIMLFSFSAVPSVGSAKLELRNRTCRSPASGSPTGFTARHTHQYYVSFSATHELSARGRASHKLS